MRIKEDLQMRILTIATALIGGLSLNAYAAGTSPTLTDADGDGYTALLCGLPEQPCTVAQLDARVGTDILASDMDDADPQVGSFCAENQGANICTE